MRVIPIDAQIESMRLTAERQAWRRIEDEEARVEAIEAEIGRLLDDPHELHRIFNQADLDFPAYEILRRVAEHRVDTPED